MGLCWVFYFLCRGVYRVDGNGGVNYLGMLVFIFLAGTKTMGWSATLLCLSPSLCIIFFWVLCSVSVLWVLCFWVGFSVLDSVFLGWILGLASRFSTPFYRLPNPSLLTSPVFAGLLSSPTRSCAIDVVHDGINFVADLQPVESGCRRRTRLFHQQRRRFGSNGFHQ